MKQCPICGKEVPVIAEVIGMCAKCAADPSDKIRRRLRKAHADSRERFDLPLTVPRSEKGTPCHLCANECRIAPNKRGYCGVRVRQGERLTGGTPRGAAVQWYYDPLPTNCVADWVCGGSREKGRKNLAVFYEACTFNCFYCQNWHFRDRTTLPESRRTAWELAAAVDSATACICYFGGDPTPSLPHAIVASRLAREQNPDRPIRICWETNGAMNPKFLNQMARLSLESGGCIKFDLKAWDRNLHEALCGVSNERTIENFRLLAVMARKRPEPPFLVASTLLVPGYVAEEEVAAIARFIASLDPGIPYALLGFAPNFCMNDLPATSKRHAFACKEIAEQAGLRNVRIGNLGTLGSDYG